jgi:glycosyl transferase family 25
MFSAFDLTLVINLESRPDRLKEVRQQLVGVGYDFGERIRVLPACRPSYPGGFRSIGAHGCFLSHMSCLEQAIKIGASSLLVLEDDVDFERNQFNPGNPILRHLAEGNWDIFYGGYGLEAPLSMETAPILPHGLRQALPTLSIGLTHFVAFHGDSIRTLHGYLGEMLKRPPGHPDGGPMDVDGAYNWFRGSSFAPRTLLADPQLGYQRASPSDVTARKWYDRLPPFAPLARMARAVRSRFE